MVEAWSFREMGVWRRRCDRILRFLIESRIMDITVQRPLDIRTLYARA